MRVLTEVDHRIKVKALADLLDLPVIVRVNKFDEDSAKKFAEDMNRAVCVEQPVIPILIDSYGGQVYALMSMIDTIKQTKTPVATVVMGKAMSCGAVLTTCGAEGMRFCAPNATIMIHDVSSFEMGKNEEIKAGAKEVERLNDSIYKVMGNNCGHGDKYFWDIVQAKGRADWYLDAAEAKQHNVVNHLRIPDFKVKLVAKVTFE